MALAKGRSAVRTGPVTLHTQTAIHIAQLMTQVTHPKPNPLPQFIYSYANWTPVKPWRRLSTVWYKLFEELVFPNIRFEMSRPLACQRSASLRPSSAVNVKNRKLNCGPKKTCHVSPYSKLDYIHSITVERKQPTDAHTWYKIISITVRTPRNLRGNLKPEFVLWARRGGGDSEKVEKEKK